MVIRAGKLRDEINIQSATLTTAAGSGAATETWASFWSTRAEVVTLEGAEGYEGDAAVSRCTHVVTTRWKAGVVPAMRVVWLTRNLQILSVVADNLRTALVIRCSENVSRN